MTSFERLEALNVEICQLTGAGKGADTTSEAIARYRAMLVARQGELRPLIAAARADTQRYVFGRVSPHSYIDGIAATLTRALIAHHKGQLPNCPECEGTGISLGQACEATADDQP
jgi:hypothetical protein